MWKRFRWKNLVRVWAVFMAIALVLLAQTLGIHYGATKFTLKYMARNEAIPAQNAIMGQRATNLMLVDSSQDGVDEAETMMKQGMREPTLQEIATEIGIPKEDIVYALDAIQNPMSLYEPVFSDNGDTLYVMDQISDKKNREDRWVEEISLSEAMKRLGVREYEIISLRFFEGKTQMEVADLIGISQAQVSRLEKNALRIMKNYLIA